MTLREKAIKGVFWSAVQNWGSLLVGTAALLVMLRILSAEAFGVFALASAMTVSIELLLRLGFNQPLIQLRELEPPHLNTAFWCSVLCGALLTAFVMLLAAPLARLFDEPQLAPVLRWLSWGFLLGAAGNTHQAVLQRRLSFRTLAMRAVIATAAGSIVGVVMALKGYGLWSLVGQSLTAGTVGTTVLWFTSGWRPGRSVSAKHFRDLFKFGITLVGSEAVNFLNVRVGVLLIGYFLGSVQLGYFAVAQRLLTALLQVLRQTVAPVAFPTFSRLQEQRDQMRHAFYTATRMTAAIGFPAFFGMSVLAPELVEGLFGDGWATSVSVLRILALAGAVESVLFLCASVMLASGKPSWRLVVMLVNGVVNVIAITVAVHLRWGIHAVAAAFVIRVYILAPLWLWSARSLIDVRFRTYLRQLVVPLLASSVMVAVVIAVKQIPTGSLSLTVTLLIYMLVGVVAYAAAVRLAAPSLVDEAREFVRLAVSSRRKGKP